jgi:hypothetical protein
MDRQSKTKRLTDPQQIPLLGSVDTRIPLDFTLADVRRLKNESHALMFSVRCSGYHPKEIPSLFGIDPGQWSNIKDGKKHFPHERRNEFMDFVGNEVLLIYGCESRGYDFSTLRKHESEIERRLREVEQENTDLKRIFKLAFEKPSK